MSIFASCSAREPRNDPQRARPQSAKSAWVMTICASALLTLSACGGSDIPDPTANGTGNGIQTKGGNNGDYNAANQGDDVATSSTATSGAGANQSNAKTDTGGDTSAAAQSAIGTVRTEKVTDAAAGPTGDYRPEGFDTLFFADEFNGIELDRSKWCTRFVWGGGPALQVPDDECTQHIGQGTLDYANIDEEQRYRDFNTLGEPLHVVNNGILQLRATKTGHDSYLQYEAAMLNSKMTFKPEGDQVYYITTRMKLPNVLGTWPSIWLAPSLDKDGAAMWPPEIDIFEGPLNNNPETEFTLHQHSQVRGAQTDSGQYEFISYDENFETTWGYYTSPDRSLRDVWIEIAAKWDVNGVCFYIDGFNTACENYRWVSNEGAPGHPANLILNLAIGGPWAGRGGVDASQFPTLLEVDYVRVYRKN